MSPDEVAILGPVIAAVMITAGVCLIVLARPRGKKYPACGVCQYDLTGSLEPDGARAATRCPECGTPFVVAGVVPASPGWRREMLCLGIALVSVAVLALAVGSSQSTRSQVIVVAPPVIQNLPYGAGQGPTIQTLPYFPDQGLADSPGFDIGPGGTIILKPDAPGDGD